MAVWNQSAVTKAGAALLAQVAAGITQLNFTVLKTSNYKYPETTDLTELTDLDNVMQTEPMSGVLFVAPDIIQVNGIITNLSLGSGYFIYAVGLYAADPLLGEILFSVTTAEKADYIPALNGNNISNIIIERQIHIGNATNVNLFANPAGLATIKYVDDAIATFPRIDYPIISDEEPPDLAIGGTWIGPLTDMGGDIIIVTPPGGGEGTSTDKHNELLNLSYEKSGHTGFMKEGGVIDGGTL